MLEMLTGEHLLLFPLQHSSERKETTLMKIPPLLLERQSLQIHGTLRGLRHLCSGIK
jgi:hypothetical protein